jgi:hypothetical protein
MHSVNHKTTQKARVELPETTLASASEDKENRVHSETSPARKRSRAKGSDNILQEHGKGKRKLSHIEEDVAPSEGVSTSTPPSTDDKGSDAIQRDDLDAQIDDEIDALLDNEIDDDEIEVIGDDDIIVSPDGIDEEDFVSEVKTEPTTLDPSTVADGKFAVILRKTISQLVEWAKEQDYSVMSPKDRAMTRGFWRLLCRVSVDFLVELILPAIPLQVQALFEKETWSLEDLLSLPSAGDDNRQGIYGNFVTGQIKNPSDIGCDAYVGSSKCLAQRVSRHLSIAQNHSLDSLPQNSKRSLHYRQICRDGAQSDFRLLVAFNQPVEEGYLHLVEGIFMVLLGTYRYQGYTHRYATRATYELTDRIRESLDLPLISWRGMNAAWPLYQGFYNRAARSPSECSNPDCDMMTFPRHLRPDDAPKSRRQHSNPEDPLGPYVCGCCGNYRYKHGVLPDREFLDKIAKRLKTRKAAGRDAKCECCERLESQARLRSNTIKKDHSPRTVGHLIHDLFPGKLLCQPCWEFVKDKQRMRTPEEVIIFLDTVYLIEARRAGEDIICDNCGEIEGSPACSGKKHLTNRETRKLLCYQCDFYYRKNQDHRPLTIAQAHVLRVKTLADRKAGNEIVCGNCEIAEGSLGTAKAFNVNKELVMILCSPCGLHWSTEGSHRDPADNRILIINARMKQDRINHNQINCDDCGAVEGSPSCKGNHVVNKTNLKVLCSNCKRTYWNK